LQKRPRPRQSCFVGQHAFAILTQAARGDAKDSTRRKDNKQHPRSPLRLLSGRAEFQIRIKSIHSFPRPLASSFWHGHSSYGEPGSTAPRLSPSHALTPRTRAPLDSWPLCSSRALISLVVPLSIRTDPSGSTHLGISLFQSINRPTLVIFPPRPSNNSLRLYPGDLSPFLPHNFLPVVPMSHPLLSIYVSLVPDGFFISLPGCAGPVNSLSPMFTIPNLSRPVRVKYKNNSSFEVHPQRSSRPRSSSPG